MSVPTGVMSNLNVRSLYCQVTSLAGLQFPVTAFVTEVQRGNRLCAQVERLVKDSVVSVAACVCVRLRCRALQRPL